MNCKLVLSASVPIVLLIGMAYFIWQHLSEIKLKKKIIEKVNSSWSSFGGGVQTTQIAELAYRLAQYMKSNSGIVNAFGFSAMLLTAFFSAIYTFSQIDPTFCK